MSSEFTVLSFCIVQSGIADESGGGISPLLRSTPKKGQKSKLPVGLISRTRQYPARPQTESMRARAPNQGVNCSLTH
jgi:hypothetical protein